MAETQPSVTTRGRRVNGTLSDGARKQAQWALLNELQGLLEVAEDNIGQLRDEGLDKWPLTADARGPLRWIAETVEALDVLGWQEIIDAGPPTVRPAGED